MIDLGFAGRSALVTGAASGIGLETAQWLARAGCDIVVADRDGAALTQAAALINAEGQRVVAITTDVRDEANVAAMVRQTVTELGRLDVAVNNVGVWPVLHRTSSSTKTAPTSRRSCRRTSSSRRRAAGPKRRRWSTLGAAA